MGDDKINLVKVLLTAYSSSWVSDDKVEMSRLPTELLNNGFLHRREIKKFTAVFVVQLSLLAYTSCRFRMV